MAVVEFEDVQLGDELRLVRSFPRRSPHQESDLLWATKAAVAEASPNWRWQIEVEVSVVKQDMLELDGYIHTLLASVRGLGKQDLVVKQGDPLQTVRTYADCRLDDVRRSRSSSSAPGNFEAALVFVFTTDQDAS